MPPRSSLHFSFKLIVIWTDEATVLFVISIVIVIMAPSVLIDDVKILDDLKMSSWFVYQQFINCNQQQSTLAPH